MRPALADNETAERCGGLVRLAYPYAKVATAKLLQSGKFDVPGGPSYENLPEFWPRRSDDQSGS